MPVEVEYRDGGACVVVTGTGLVTGDEIYAANQEIYSEERIGPQRCQLVDFTSIKDFEVSPPDVVKLAEQDRAAAERNPDIRIAIAVRKNMIYGLAKMWDELMESSRLETRVFRSREEAEAWLAEERNP